MDPGIRTLIVEWNLKYKYDRAWRLKYRIPFGSQKHLEVSQIDMMFDVLEDKVFEELQKEYEELKIAKKEYLETGKFLKEQVVPEEKEEDILHKLKASFKK